MPHDPLAAARELRLVPPDSVFFVVWPLLKLGALRTDLRIVRAGTALPSRGTVVLLRVLDWVTFLAFPRVAPRSGSVAVVTGLTLIQALATGEVVRRGRRHDPDVAVSLLPQFLWLAYATAVPALVTTRVRARARRAGGARRGRVDGRLTLRRPMGAVSRRA